MDIQANLDIHLGCYESALMRMIAQCEQSQQAITVPTWLGRIVTDFTRTALLSQHFAVDAKSGREMIYRFFDNLRWYAEDSFM